MPQIKVGDLRKLLADVPDESLVLIWDDNFGVQPASAIDIAHFMKAEYPINEDGVASTEANYERVDNAYGRWLQERGGDTKIEDLGIAVMLT